MNQLDLIYANSNTGGPTPHGALLDEWRRFPEAEVWTRRVTTDETDTYFFKAKGHQHRVEFLFRTFTPDEADAYSEQLAEEFAAHRVKTDPAQIREAMADIVVKKAAPKAEAEAEAEAEATKAPAKKK